MPSVMSPERRQQLLAAIDAFIRERYSTLVLPSFSTSMICYDVCDEKHTESEPAKPEPAVQYSLKETRQPDSNDDWDVLERIFPRKDSFQKAKAATIHDIIEEAEKEETFSEALLRIIREKELEEPEVYNSVFMDRKLFNKIRNTPEYQPSKRTALLLAVALKLDLEETNEFIGKAGFRLAHWNKFDIIVEYFIVNGNYDILEINEMLAEFKMPLLLRCD